MRRRTQENPARSARRPSPTPSSTTAGKVERRLPWTPKRAPALVEQHRRHHRQRDSGQQPGDRRRPPLHRHRRPAPARLLAVQPPGFHRETGTVEPGPLASSPGRPDLQRPRHARAKRSGGLTPLFRGLPISDRAGLLEFVENRAQGYEIRDSRPQAGSDPVLDRPAGLRYGAGSAGASDGIAVAANHGHDLLGVSLVARLQDQLDAGLGNGDLDAFAVVGHL
jgi:hypothetical protein